LYNNSSAFTWLHKSNIGKSKIYHLHKATRKRAKILIHSGHCLYSQHIKGAHNSVANVLSRVDVDSPDHLQHFTGHLFFLSARNLLQDILMAAED
jgi:hypothetical protein